MVASAPAHHRRGLRVVRGAHELAQVVRACVAGVRLGAGGCVNRLVQGPSHKGTENRRQTRVDTKCSEERKKEGEQ